MFDLKRGVAEGKSFIIIIDGDDLQKCSANTFRIGIDIFIEYAAPMRYM
jgi:hypothetical protein